MLEIPAAPSKIPVPEADISRMSPDSNPFPEVTSVLEHPSVPMLKQKVIPLVVSPSSSTVAVGIRIENQQCHERRKESPRIRSLKSVHGKGNLI